MITLFGVLVLSIGLVRLVFMTGSAGAVPPVKPVKEDALAGVTQNWDKNLPSTSRFTVLAAFGNAAVQDKNTGLVWQQATDGITRTWTEATFYCVNKTVGGTTGWRLPSVAELNSVRDPSLLAGFVPAVFSGVQGNRFWSATTVSGDPTNAWLVDFSGGTVVIFSKGTSAWVWCVRGPMNAEAY